MTRHAARCFLPLLAALSLQLSGCSADSPQSATTPEPSTNSPATGAPSASEPTSLRNFVGPIAPGSHRVPLISWDQTYPLDALVEVPDGFITPGGWVVENGLSGAAYGDLMFFGDVDRVASDPCPGGRLVTPGPTVRDLAEALTGEVPRRYTSPEPVLVGGHRGLYVETTAPRDLSRCDGGQFTLWKGDPADPFGYHTEQPGTVFHLWILDVDGQRVVVAVRVVPGHTTHAAELVHMAETAEFVENVGG
jgi:hypothetical protein